MKRALIPNIRKNIELCKEAAQIFCLERVTIAKGQGTSEDEKFVAKPTRQNSMFFLIFGITLLALVPALMHADGCYRELSPCDDGNPANRAECITPSGNPSAKDGAHLFVTGDALYWIASENGLAPYSLTAINIEGSTGSTPTASAAQQRIKNLNFKWDWGSRISLGSNIPHDQWDLSFAWTRFHTSASKKATIDPVTLPTGALAATFIGDVILPNWSFTDSILPNGGATTIIALAAKWKLHLNLFDLNLGRKFFVSKWLTLRPNVGVRGAIIDQKYQIASIGSNLRSTPPAPSADAIQMKNNFRAIGLLGGLDTQWGLFNEFSIYANAAISLLYGRFHIDQREALAALPSGVVSPQPINDALEIRDRFHNLKAITDLALGIQWDHFFADGGLHLGMHVGWEHHLFFGQNQLKQYIANSALSPSLNAAMRVNYVALNQDLTLQGGVAGIRLDF